MLPSLDPILHSQVRLAIISILMSVESAEFSYLLDHTNTSKGNLSFQLSKLKTAGYVAVEKSFRGNFPLTTCRITPKGLAAFRQYVEAMTDYLKLS